MTFFCCSLPCNYIHGKIFSIKHSSPIAIGTGLPWSCALCMIQYVYEVENTQSTRPDRVDSLYCLPRFTNWLQSWRSRRSAKHTEWSAHAHTDTRTHTHTHTHARTHALLHIQSDTNKWSETKTTGI